MAPKRVTVQSSSPSSRASSSGAIRGRNGGRGPGRKLDESSLSRAYTMITDPENAAVLKAVGLFAVGVAFFASGLSEILVPA